MYACRYVWSNRVGLARSVHDMAKQMYDNTKYSPIAWMPLRKWLFNDDDDKVAARRAATLTHFGKDDTGFYEVVARCLYKLATGPNVPWGRGPANADAYCNVPIHEKVRRFFLRVFFLSVNI